MCFDGAQNASAGRDGTHSHGNHLGGLRIRPHWQGRESLVVRKAYRSNGSNRSYWIGATMILRFVAAACFSLLIALTPCVSQAQQTTQTDKLERNIRAELGFLASDAMQGRGSGSGYERLAAEYIGSQFRQFGLEPAGDTDANGQQSFVQRAALSETVTWNAVGVLRGSDRASAKEVIMLSAHLDHLGTNENAAPGTDAIF